MFDEIGNDIDELFGGYEFTHNVIFSSFNKDLGLRVSGEGAFSSTNALSSSISISQAKEGGSFAIENFSLTNEGRISGEVSIITGPASKLYVCAQDERSEPGRNIKSSGKIGAEYRSERCCIDTNIDIVNGPIGSSTFLYKYSPWNLQFGANLKVNSHWDDNSRGKDSGKSKKLPSEIETIDFCLAYIDPNYKIYGKTLNRVNTMALGYLYQASPKLLYGAVVDYSFYVNSQNLAVGASYKIDEKLFVKGKMSSSAQLAGMMTHRINDSVKISLAGGVDLRDSFIPPKIGIGLVFDAV